MAQDTWFPISCLNHWHAQFLSKLQLDPVFWKK